MPTKSGGSVCERALWVSEQPKSFLALVARARHFFAVACAKFSVRVAPRTRWATWTKSRAAAVASHGPSGCRSDFTLNDGCETMTIST